MSFGTGLTDLKLPSASNITGPFAEGTAASEGAMANRYSQLGMGGSSAEQRDLGFTGDVFNIAETEQLNQFAEQNFRNQLNLQNQGNPLLQLAGLAGL